MSRHPNPWTRWRAPIEREERARRWFWLLVLLWLVALGFALWSCWFHFIPFLIKLTK